MKALPFLVIISLLSLLMPIACVWQLNRNKSLVLRIWKDQIKQKAFVVFFFGIYGVKMLYTFYRIEDYDPFFIGAMLVCAGGFAIWLFFVWLEWQRAYRKQLDGLKSPISYKVH